MVWIGLISLIFPKLMMGCEPKVNLGGSISFCSGNNIILNASYPNSVYLWSTGQVTPTITVSTSGTYWVSVTNSCGNTRDTIDVYVDQPLNINLGNNKTICKGSTLTLTPPFSPSYQYTWQDGSQGSSFTVTQAGTYHVTVQNSCGVFSDTISITEEDPPVVNLGPDIFKCDNSPVTLDAGIQASPVRWSTAQSGRFITVSNTGTYWAFVRNACGTFYDSVDVYYSKGPTLNLGNTIHLCIGGTITLDPGAGTQASYLWSTGAQTPTLTVGSPGTYWLRLTDACGVFYDTVNVVPAGPANVNLGPDTAICRGQSITLNAGFPGSNYQWSVGSFQRTITVDSAGVYWVGVDNGCGYRYDSIEIIEIIPPRDSLPDTLTVCPGRIRTVDAGYWGPNTNYIWDDNSTGRTHDFGFPGLHWVTVSNPCGVFTDTFALKNDQPYVLNLGPDTTLCEPYYDLFAGKLTPYDTVVWSTGDSAVADLRAISTAVYWVEVRNACGIFRDSVRVVLLKPNSGIKSGGSDICEGDTMQLWVLNQQETNYLWSTGDTTSAISISQAGTYWVDISNLCDTISDTITIYKDHPIVFSLGPDDTICQGDIRVLDVSGAGADSVIWNTGLRTTVLPVDSSGTYWVEMYNACGLFTDTVHIEVKPQPQRKLQPVNFCTDTTYTLDASQSVPSTYLWNNGAQTPTLTISQGGWYYVDITNSCGIIRDSVFVTAEQYIPQFNLGKDTVFCQGSITLDPGTYTGASYLWQNGLRSPTLIANRSGTYFVKVENSCNARWDTINVLITGPPKLILGTEVRFCYTNTFTLNAQNPGCDYLWNTGDTTQSIVVDTSGTFWCTISNPCGVLTDTVEVIIEYDLDDLDLGPDTLICEGETLTLHTRYPDTRTVWQDGSGEEFFQVTQTGLYWVELFNTCGQWEDSIYVEVEGVPVFTLGPDTGICIDDGNLRLTGPQGMSSYLWSNGEQTRETVFLQPGKHWLTVTNSCFSYTDTIYAELEYPIDVDLGPDTSFCETEMYWLDSRVENYTVRWENGSTGRYRELSSTGMYWARVRNSCGVFYDTVSVRFDEILTPPVVDTLICRDDSALVDLTNLAYDFKWFDGKTQKVRTFTEAGIYPLYISNKCGTFEQLYLVSLSNCDCPLFVPNSFTPNGDGLNEKFRIGHSCMLKQYYLQIFDRWGMLVFETNDPAAEWDGTFKGDRMSPGVYSYQLYYEWNVYQSDRQKTKHGTISLLR